VRLLITRRQALRDSTFALGGTVVTSQLAKAETSGQNAGFYRLKVGAFEVTVLSDGSFSAPSPLLATNLAEADLKEFVKANHIGADTFRTQINIVLVNTGDRAVLIDAGSGGWPQPTTGRLAASLQAAGIEPTAVDLTSCLSPHSLDMLGI
jgi:hypothetical protein